MFGGVSVANFHGRGESGISSASGFCRKARPMLEAKQQIYGGRRILEAMHGAVRYSNAVLSDVLSAKPATAQLILDFGAGDGAFAGRFHQRNISIDCLEPDPDLHAGLRPSANNVYSDTAQIENASYDFIYTI